MITYEPLWQYMAATDPATGKRRRLTELYDDPKRPDRHAPIGISRATITRMRNNGFVSLETINAICERLSLQPGDILEWQPGPQPAYIRPEKRKESGG